MVSLHFLSGVLHILWSWVRILTYSSSCNLTPTISRVLIVRHLIFCPPTWLTCCSSPRKYTLVKYKVMPKAGFPIVTYTTSWVSTFIRDLKMVLYILLVTLYSVFLIFCWNLLTPHYHLWFLYSLFVASLQMPNFILWIGIFTCLHLFFCGPVSLTWSCYSFIVSHITWVSYFVIF